MIHLPLSDVKLRFFLNLIPNCIDRVLLKKIKLKIKKKFIIRPSNYFVLICINE